MAEQPNVVVAMTDQQRADLSAREGFPLDTTPHLDDLAESGVWFDRAYTSSPVCVPARTGFLTGRFPTASRVWVNRAGDAATYDRDLFDVLGAAGYRTAMIGKNHSYLDPEKPDHWFPVGHFGAHEAAESARTSEQAAFDDWLSGLSMPGGGGGFATEPTPFPPECQLAHRVVSEARDWIRSLDDEPFFCWLSFPEPHNPYQVPEPYFSLFPPGDLPDVRAGPDALADRRFKWRWLRTIAAERAGNHDPDADYDDLLPRLRANYLGLLRLLDDQVRRFTEFLDDAGLRDETLLAFVSDHGDFAGEYGLMRKGVDLPEATTRVPLFFAGVGVEGDDDPGPHPAHVSVTDVMPTICDAVDAPLPAGVQGRSLRPLLTGDDYPAEEFDSVYAECGYGGRHYDAADAPPIDDASLDELNAITQTGRTSTVRRGRWKVVVDEQDGVELYDLDADPAETTDVSRDPAHADRLADLLADHGRWSLHARDTLPGAFEPRPGPRNYWRTSRPPDG